MTNVFRSIFGWESKVFIQSMSNIITMKKIEKFFAMSVVLCLMSMQVYYYLQKIEKKRWKRE